MHILSHVFFRTPARLAGVLLFLCAYNTTIAQQVVTQDVTEHSFKIFDSDGKPFVNPYIDVAGSPFFLEDWKYGKIKVADNRIFSGIRLKLDLLSQQVHFLKSDNVEMVSPVAIVREITLFDSASPAPVTYLFQCGFPSIDNQDEKNFYLVICDGKIKFLQAMRKVIHQDKDEYAGTVIKEFRQYDDYYFLPQGGSALQRIKRDKEFVLNFMKDKKDKMDAFLQTNKISFKSTDDIRKLVDYYNQAL